jgi:hypothetical protein
MMDLQDQTVNVWSGADVVYYAIYPIPKVRVCVWKQGTVIKGQIIDERGGGMPRYARWDVQERDDRLSMEDVCRTAARAVAAAFDPHE